MANRKRRREMPDLGFPQTVSASAPDIHIEGNREISVEGCRGILEYENDRITLKLKHRNITVTGQRLTMRSFFGSHIRIIGIISSVCFEEDGL